MSPVSAAVGNRQERARWLIWAEPDQPCNVDDEWQGIVLDADGLLAQQERRFSCLTEESVALDGQVPGPGLWIAEAELFLAGGGEYPDSEPRVLGEMRWRRPLGREIDRMMSGERVLVADPPPRADEPPAGPLSEMLERMLAGGCPVCAAPVTDHFDTGAGQVLALPCRCVVHSPTRRSA